LFSERKILAKNEYICEIVNLYADIEDIGCITVIVRHEMPWQSVKAVFLL